VQTRQDLKHDLRQRATALGQQALLPAEKRDLDAIVNQLESLNPTPCPLALAHRSLLLGDWNLIYASHGTVVTRQLPGGLTIHSIWQSLAALGEEAIAATNGMELELPLLGRWQLQVQGVWRWQGETPIATVAFDAFSLQATRLFHQSGWQFPALHLPVLEGLRREASWQTSYLDSELRIGRGATGNRFVFVRSPASDIASSDQTTR